MFKQMRTAVPLVVVILATLLFVSGCGGGDTTTIYAGSGDGGSSPLPPPQQPLCQGPDTDGDGLPDCQETMGWQATVDFNGRGTSHSYTVTSDPAVADTDGDGLSDLDEFRLRTDARVADTDGDGLTDREEILIYASHPGEVDSDGDTIHDGKEVFQHRTSPILADTDGDGVRDDIEVNTTGFNPLVAELPKLRIFVSTAPTLALNATTSTEQVSTTLQGRTDAASRGGSKSLEATMKSSTSIKAEVEVKTGVPPSASGKVSAEQSFEAGVTASTSSNWSAESTRQSQQEFENSVSQTFTDGTINLGFSIVNQGERSVTVKNLRIAVLKRNIFDYNQTPELITELVPREAGSAAEGPVTFEIANGASKGPLLAQDAKVPAQLMRKLMADPRGLDFVVSSFDFADPGNEGLNYAAIAQNTAARTALVVFDFGDGRVERYMVATSVKRDERGDSVGLTMAEVMDLLRIPYTTDARRALDGTTIIGPKVLTGVRDKTAYTAGEINQLNPSRLWFIATSFDVAPGVDFENIVLKSRDIIILSHEQDTDGDGLIDRHEALFGTNIHVKDTDGDGDDDGFEVANGTDPLGVTINRIELALTGNTTTVAGSGATSAFVPGIGEAASLGQPIDAAYAGDAVYFSATTATILGSYVGKLDLKSNAVTLIAGSATERGFVNGTGAAARFGGRLNLAIDGNILYIADQDNHAIRKMDLATGAVTTLVGNGKTPDGCPLGGADGDATVATFNRPAALTVSGGYLYVADALNRTLRRVDKLTGRTSTVAGKCPNLQEAGLGVFATVGPIFGVVDGIGANARFIEPSGITSDGVFLHVIDGCWIRKVRIATGEVTKLAGAPYGPQPLQVEAFINRVVVDQDVPGASLCGAADGEKDLARFEFGLGAGSMSSDGTNLYFSDVFNSSIRRVNIITGRTDTVAGVSGGLLGAGYAEGTAARFGLPRGVISDGVFLYVMDTGNGRIRRID